LIFAQLWIRTSDRDRMRPSCPLAVLIFGLAAAGCGNAPGTPLGGSGKNPAESSSPASGATPTKKCVGEARQCWEAVAIVACFETRGCSVGGFCTGIPKDCVSQHGQDCGGQNGCKRNATDDACVGVPTACAKLKAFEACDHQEGCSWEYTSCGGDAGTCDEVSVDECDLQFGCYLVD
jgi:hypothetical protein